LAVAVVLADDVVAASKTTPLTSANARSTPDLLLVIARVLPFLWVIVRVVAETTCQVGATLIGRRLERRRPNRPQSMV
jgi:hypothetical protein